PGLPGRWLPPAPVPAHRRATGLPPAPTALAGWRAGPARGAATRRWPRRRLPRHEAAPAHPSCGPAGIAAAPWPVGPDTRRLPRNRRRAGPDRWLRSATDPADVRTVRP